jgi:hypothetical protein
MLRSIKYPNSKIHKIQSFINHVMLDVIFNSRKFPNVSFSSALVLPKYRSLINDTNNKYLFTPLNKAFKICKRLERKDLKLLKQAVHNNNKIRELCNGDIEPIKYKQIKDIDPALSKAIRKFCDSLYDHCLKLAPFYSSYGHVGAYYKTIVKKSKTCKCCGIGAVLTQFHTHRGALDHYLPKSIYPYNSLNFKNLIPICEYCNGKYKLGKDTLSKTKNKGKKNETYTRVKAFYPFSRTEPDIDITINFVKLASVKNIEPKNVKLEINCVGKEEQIETWDRIFGIKENYIAECCTEEMLMHFEEEYIADMNFGQTHEQYINKLEANKFGNINFLKIPFLNALNA